MTAGNSSYLFISPSQNTPNDLQLLSDAPAHHIFCLLGPVDPAQNTLPEVYCVLQVKPRQACTIEKDVMITFMSDEKRQNLLII